MSLFSPLQLCNWKRCKIQFMYPLDLPIVDGRVVGNSPFVGIFLASFTPELHPGSDISSHTCRHAIQMNLEPFESNRIF